MESMLRTFAILLCRWLIFIPGLFCFSYLLRPLLMLVLIPGALMFLAIIGGPEVRSAIMKMVKDSV
ncbi:hypothetical protein OH458_16445 [Vibrio sp. MarTm2]|uniref:Uncharacterized protein n=1 Tax=Vibrio caribbeanicus TaxID=701175 RepID=A0ACC4NTM1_9VIBR|nr:MULTISPECIES: hypothetical protein [Vibrio]KHD23857.1 hypothetical protein NM09_15210 [Vibrio caribbeanicus]KHT49457.1 hypothetical protein RJ46_07820 [Vibrio sinaloensis]MDA0129660.1 hypothetical protein [Vibrio sp. MarTm2]